MCKRFRELLDLFLGLWTRWKAQLPLPHYPLFTFYSNLREEKCKKIDYGRNISEAFI